MLALAATLPACSTVYESRYDFREGWRKAEVVQVASARELERPDFYRCVRDTPAQQRANHQYVILRWDRMGTTAWHAQPLEPGQRWAPGEAVYVNVSRCNGEIVRRAA